MGDFISTIRALNGCDAGPDALERDRAAALREAHAIAYGTSERCPFCEGTTLIPLGQLGDTSWCRCRDCGATFGDHETHDGALPCA